MQKQLSSILSEEPSKITNWCTPTFYTSVHKRLHNPISQEWTWKEVFLILSPNSLEQPTKWSQSCRIAIYFYCCMQKYFIVLMHVHKVFCIIRYFYFYLLKFITSTITVTITFNPLIINFESLLTHFLLFFCVWMLRVFAGCLVK